MRIIAGHTFIDTHRGVACEGCGVLYVHVMVATKDDINKKGYCHSGSLTENEYNQIVQERDRLWTAVADVASGRGGGAIQHEAAVPEICED